MLNIITLPFIAILRVIKWPVRFFKTKAVRKPTLDEEVWAWYHGHKTNRSIHEMLADFLPEGEPYKEEKYKPSCSAYTLGGYSYSYQQYKKDQGKTQISVRNWSIAPNNRKVRNDWQWRLGTKPLKEQANDD